eukprot:2967816-Rhodomonas_salina.1
MNALTTMQLAARGAGSRRRLVLGLVERVLRGLELTLELWLGVLALLELRPALALRHHLLTSHLSTDFRQSGFKGADSTSLKSDLLLQVGGHRRRFRGKRRRSC